MNLPKITLVTPSYNQGQYIEQTILSVIEQGYPNLEYMVIDGGSTDETVDIIRKYEGRISYWVSEKDKGQSHAINKGFRMATGEIINWLNSDDLLAEGALFHIAESFSNYPQAAMIHGQCVHFTDEARIDKNQPFEWPPKRHLKGAYLAGFPYSQPSCFYKREVLDHIGFVDEDFHFTMDYDLFVRMALNYQFQPANAVFSYFRMHPESKTNTLQKTQFAENQRVFSGVVKTWERAGFEGLLIKHHLFVEGGKKYPVFQEQYTVEEQNDVMAAHLWYHARAAYGREEWQKAYKIIADLKGFFPEQYAWLNAGRLYWRLKFVPSAVLALHKKYNALSK